MGVSQNWGYLFGGPCNNKDWSILGSILGSPNFGETTIGWHWDPGLRSDEDLTGIVERPLELFMRQIGETSAWVHINGLYGGGRHQTDLNITSYKRETQKRASGNSYATNYSHNMPRYPVMLFPLYQITEASLGCASARRCVSRKVFMFTKGYRHCDHLSNPVSPT